jgi:hypothetical protein
MRQPPVNVESVARRKILWVSSIRGYRLEISEHNEEQWSGPQSNGDTRSMVLLVSPPEFRYGR